MYSHESESFRLHMSKVQISEGFSQRAQEPRFRERKERIAFGEGLTIDRGLGEICRLVTFC